MIEKAKEILSGGVKVFLQAKAAKNVEPKREQLSKARACGTWTSHIKKG